MPCTLCRHVVEELQNQGLLRMFRADESLQAGTRPQGEPQLVPPLAASLDALADVHKREYLEELSTSNFKIVQVIEMPALMMVPNSLLQWRLVSSCQDLPESAQAEVLCTLQVG